MIYLKKFNELYNQIIFETVENSQQITNNNEKVIKYKEFDYKFTESKDGNIICTFKSIDNKNKLIIIQATIYKNNTYEFKVTDTNDKDKVYTDKEFLLAYYKEYQDFKKVLSLYRAQMENTQQSDDKPYEIIDGKQMPKIEQFNSALLNTDDTENGIMVTGDEINFTFKKVDDQSYKDLILITFSFVNPNELKSQSDLYQYDVICLAKIYKDNFAVLKVSLYDPENLKDSEPIETLSDMDFKETFTSIYYKLHKAMSKYLSQYLIDKKF